MYRDFFVTSLFASIATLFAGCEASQVKTANDKSEAAAPNWALKQAERDKQTLSVFNNEGDSGKQNREIIHYAYFADETSAQKYGAILLGNNYKISSTSISKADGEAFPYSIKFTHNGTIVFKDITSHTTLLTEEAFKLNGEYDGWEAPIIKD